MGLAIKKNSAWWYGRYMLNGKEHFTNLQIKVRGTRPRTLGETGSVQFENSRGEAQAAFDNLLDRVHQGKSEVVLAEAVYEARVGEKLKRHSIDSLPLLWEERPRRRKPSDKHLEISLAKLGRFVAFIKAGFPEVVQVDQIRRLHVQAFLDALEKGDLPGLENHGVSAETWNKYLVPIKTALKRAGNPAAREIVPKEAETIFRQPFSIDDLQAIFEAAARIDPLLYSLSVTAACTAMRRKDCCNLKWSDVDLEAGFITVKTSKTGATVDIPLADMLRAEILKQEGNGSPYVFPAACKLYKANPSALSGRFKKVLEAAGFDCGAIRPPVEFMSDPCTLEELHEAAAGICRTAEKLERVKAVAEAYLAGKSVKAAAKATGLSVASVSLYLNELEAKTGKAIIRGKRREVEPPAIPSPTRGAVRQERETGILSASIRDFHSFRTTFVTLALMSGMPLDIVRKITGHKTAEVVMKHYFRPEREQLRAAMQKALPGLLSSSVKPFTPAERAADLLRTANAGNWRTCIDRALEILESGNGKQGGQGI